MFHTSKKAWLKLLLITIISFSGLNTTFAQEITLKKTKTPLESVLKDVGNQSDYVFFYNKEEISAIDKVTINLKAVPLKQALKTILEGTDLEFEIFEKTIVIKKKVPGPAGLTNTSDSIPENVSKPQKLIKGKVTDENNLPLGQILILEQTSQLRTKSNDKGEFTLLAPASGTLSFSGKKFREQLVDYVDSTSLITVKMESQAIELNNVDVSLDLQKKEPGRFVDMKNRNYMSLSQVLQGTVPGLSLQIVNTTSKQITSIDAWVNIRNGVSVRKVQRFSVEEFLGFFLNAQKIIDQLLSGRYVPETIRNNFKLNTITKTTSTLVPQIRGGNTFSSNAANMLVVIDGFPQDGFPADYPMINVESIEVIKDQKELIKWGPKASGGLILIKTKAAKKGQIAVNYTTNFYYTPAQKYDRKKLQLASTVDYLDFLKDADAASNVAYTNASQNFSAARRLFAQNRNGLISTDTYNKRLDSLKGLDNESQMAMLQQDRFSQSHALGLSGGTENYKFNLMSTYSSEKTSDLNGYAKTLGFNLNNDFILLNDKLKINLLINYVNGNSRSGYSFSPETNIEPYQMLKDAQGNYVYDYTDFSPYANATIVSKGYKNYGVNILEDATVNKFLNRSIEKKTSLNAKWDLLPGLSWATSVYYTGTNARNSTLYGKESSYARQLVDDYGEYNANGVNFYVPYGDILSASNRNREEVNVRSSLNYTKAFGKHEINLTAGGGLASISSHAPAVSTIYGFNSANNTSSSVFLPSPNPKGTINNYYTVLDGSAANKIPYTLTLPVNGDTTLSRNVNANAALSYKYSDRLVLSGAYTAVYHPVYGESASYSTSKNYHSDATGLVLKNVGNVLQNIYVSVGAEGTKLPDLPTTYSNLRTVQTQWENYSIWVTGLQGTQQLGQSSRNIYQKLTLGILDSTLLLNGAYNTQTRKGTLISLTPDPATSSQSSNVVTVQKYFSAGVKGRMRKGLLGFQFDYSKSPEGQTQLNGSGNYDIGREKYLHSNSISSMNVGFKIENISAFQGLGLMMGTNASTNGSYTQATNSSFNQLPPKNTSYEANAQMGLNDEAQLFDVRFYRQTSSGLNNYAPVLVDPSTGLASRVTYSMITNKGVEFFFKTRVIKSDNFEYNITLNGAYNVNIATDVPITEFTGADNYATAYREGYDVSSLWSVKSAGLNNTGDPQIYDKNGKVTATLDSATVAGSVVYSGVSRAPWTGGLIQEVNYKSFFARAAVTFNLGSVMRTYIPYLTSNNETSILIANRWRNPGDEAFTEVPRISTTGDTYRAFVTHNGTNSIVSADAIRFQEFMIGCNVPQSILKKLGVKAITIALQAQNLALWTNNKLHLDPSTVTGAGKIGLPIAKQYSCNISVSF